MRDSITLKDMETLWSDIELLTTIGEWKSRVSKFKIKYSLTDREAIDIANKHF